MSRLNLQETIEVSLNGRFMPYFVFRTLGKGCTRAHIYGHIPDLDYIPKIVHMSDLTDRIQGNRVYKYTFKNLTLEFDGKLERMFPHTD